MADADEPLRISIDSMSAGLMSATRLTGLSCVSALSVPDYAALMALMPPGIEALLISTPSIT